MDCLPDLPQPCRFDVEAFDQVSQSLFESDRVIKLEDIVRRRLGCETIDTSLSLCDIDRTPASLNFGYASSRDEY